MTMRYIDYADLFTYIHTTNDAFRFVHCGITVRNTEIQIVGCIKIILKIRF